MPKQPKCSSCGSTDDMLIELKPRHYICRYCVRQFADMLMAGLSACTCGSQVIHLTHPDGAGEGK